MGTMFGSVTGVLEALHTRGIRAGSRNQTGRPEDPPQNLRRFLPPGPGTSVGDAAIISAGNGLPRMQQWRVFRRSLERIHGAVHVQFGRGSEVSGQHR